MWTRRAASTSGRFATGCCSSCSSAAACVLARRSGCCTVIGSRAGATRRTSTSVPREHPHGQRVKSGLPRRIYVTDRVDRLYGEYLWQLCDAGADVVLGDMDRALVFVNVAGGELFAPWRPGSVYSLVARLKRILKHKVPAGWTPHWFRHTHATALLLGRRPAARRLAAPGPRRRADHDEPLWVGERRRRAARDRRLAASDGDLGAPYCCVATPSRPTSSTARRATSARTANASGCPFPRSFAGCTSWSATRPSGRAGSLGARRSARCWTFATFPRRSPARCSTPPGGCSISAPRSRSATRARSCATCAGR